MEVTGSYEEVLNVIGEADRDYEGQPIPALEIVDRAEVQGLAAGSVEDALPRLESVGLITLTDRAGGPAIVVGKEVPTFVVHPGGGQFVQLTLMGRQWLLGQGPVAGIPEALDAELYAADEGLGEWRYRIPIRRVRRIWDVLIERLASTWWTGSEDLEPPSSCGGASVKGSQRSMHGSMATNGARER